MQDDHGPEHDQEGEFLRLVAEVPLPDQRSGPAAEERQELQRAFGDTPTATGGTLLIPAVGNEAGKAHHEDDAEVSDECGNHAIILSPVGSFRSP